MINILEKNLQIINNSRDQKKNNKIINAIGNHLYNDLEALL